MEIKVALVGNPNVGKTSVFNTLTGLRQKVGNYPGITVAKKTATVKLEEGTLAKIIDLPGIYSTTASSKDEEVVLDTLFDKSNPHFPDVVVVVAEVENLKRNLYLLTQIKDLGFPTILAVNMADRMKSYGISLDAKKLEEKLRCKTVLISTRTGEGLDTLKKEIVNYKGADVAPLLDLKNVDSHFFGELATKINGNNFYSEWTKITNKSMESDGEYASSDIKKLLHKEAIKRYQLIGEALKVSYEKDASKATGFSASLDKILTHRILGYLIFFGIMLMVFQAIFSWATIPMDFIDEQFANLSSWLTSVLPEGKFTELLAEGIVPGIGGVVIFIPQIAILFMFISILEESGYMSRVVFLMDKIMRPFGLSGKSVIPLISGVACAIPAIMSARNIENSKERLITMLVTPFATCSARIPVYVIIISLVIPAKSFYGIGLQGFVMTCMYFLGFAAALGGAWLLKLFIKSTAKSYLVVEMPPYRWPQFKNVGNVMVEKTRAFVEGAGKIILSLSVVLWFLGSHGPASTFGNAEEIVSKNFAHANLDQAQMDDEVQGYKLRESYIGIIGSYVEPVFKPLGYDWKISIAVLTSFAAREVFVGNLATLYNIGSKSDTETSIIKRMAAEVWPDGTKVFGLGTGISLLLFYAFAMQCISTIATMRKETNSWKWTAFQAFFMTGLAYICALVAYNFLK